MTLFVDDAIAGDALAVAEDDLRHGDIKVVPAGNQIVEQMRKYCSGNLVPSDSTGGIFMISERQVEALAELADWLANPASDPMIAPGPGAAVVNLAREIVTEPAPV